MPQVTRVQFFAKLRTKQVKEDTRDDWLRLSSSGKFRSSAKLCQPAARVCFDHVLQSAMGINVLAGFVPTRGGLTYIICTYISSIH